MSCLPSTRRRSAVRPPTHQREAGSGTIWVLAVAALLVLGGVVAATIAAVASAGRTADTAADLAALSAAAGCGNVSVAGCGDAVHGPCAVAQRIAVAHRTRLVACSVTEGVVDVVVEVRPRSLVGGVFVLRSRARAGRSSDESSARSASRPRGQASWSRSEGEPVRR